VKREAVELAVVADCHEHPADTADHRMRSRCSSQGTTTIRPYDSIVERTWGDRAAVFVSHRALRFADRGVAEGSRT